MTAILQSPTTTVNDLHSFDIASLRPGQVLTLACEGGSQWHISLTDISRRHGDTIAGVMVMTNSPNRGHRVTRPPGDTTIGRYVSVGKSLTIGYGNTEAVQKYSVSKHSAD